MHVFVFVVYFLCIILGGVSLFLSLPKKANNILLFFLILLLVLAAGFRNGISGYPDYMSYVLSYESFDYEVFESSFGIICEISRWIDNGNYYILFLIYATLGVTLKCLAIRRLSSCVYLSLAIYISYFYLLHELIQIRVGVASAIGLLAVKPAYYGDFKRFILLVFLASFFHESAFLYLLLYFLKKDSFDSTDYKCFIFFIAVFLFLNKIGFSDILQYLPLERAQDKIAIYDISGKGESPFSIFGKTYLLYYFLVLLFLANARKIVIYNKYFYMLLRVEILGLLFGIIFNASIPILSIRLFELFNVVSIIMIPMLVYVFKSRIIGTLFVMVIGASFIYANFYIREFIP